MKSRLFLLLNFALAAVLIWLALRQVDPANVLRCLRAASPGYAALAFLIAMSVRLLFIPALWRGILGRLSVRTSFADIVAVNGLALALKSVTPFKASEVVRSVASKVLLDVPLAAAAASALFLRFATLLGGLVVFCLAALAHGATAWLAGGLCALAAGAAVLFLSGPALRRAGGGGFLRESAACLASLGNAEKAALVGQGTLIGAAEAAACYLAMLSAGVYAGPGAGFFGVSKIMLLSCLPISVQGIGLRENLYVLEFGAAHNPEAAFLAGLLATLACGLAPSAAGGLAWLFLRPAGRCGARGLATGVAGRGELRMDAGYLGRRKRNLFTVYKLRRRSRAVLSAISRYACGSAFSVLDVGACDGGMLYSIKEAYPGAVCRGVEPEPGFLPEKGPAGVEVAQGRAERLPYPAASFDFAVVSSVIEHVADPEAALGELLRVLKPGGKAVVITVIPAYERLAVLLRVKKDDHFRNYRPAEIAALLSRKGFRIAESRSLVVPFFYWLTVAEKV